MRPYQGLMIDHDEQAQQQEMIMTRRSNCQASSASDHNNIVKFPLIFHTWHRPHDVYEATASRGDNKMMMNSTTTMRTSDDDHTNVVSNSNDNSTSKSTVGAAPFVLKTYEMVNDPATDHLIAWSPTNNSFFVFDPLSFSAFILPSRFKHNNFSSFVRQLNTYGFRKVHPDRWEFANEWFLRGQTHLLNRIVRKAGKHHPTTTTSHPDDQDDDDDEQERREQEQVQERIRAEIERLKREQTELEKEMEGMTRRLELTERRPDQMMSFLRRVAHEPGFLPRLAVERRRRLIFRHDDVVKRRRLLAEEEDRRRTTDTSQLDDQVKACGSVTMASEYAPPEGWEARPPEPPTPYPFSLLG